MFRIQIVRAQFSIGKIRRSKAMFGKAIIIGQHSYSICVCRLSKNSEGSKVDDTNVVSPDDLTYGSGVQKKLMPDGKLLDILKIYKNIHKNLHIYPSYKIPADDSWPSEYHGYPLGKKVTMIRTNEDCLWDFFKFRLNKLGFIWKALDYRFNKADHALKVYQSLHGNLIVPQNFVVPSDSIDWPKPLWGYNLGKIVHHIRCTGIYPSKRKYLEDMGFVFDVKHVRTHDFPLIKKCIKLYGKKYGTFQIPYNYVVPTNDKDYPAKARGLPLGCVFSNIVHRNYFAQHHEELREMGVSLLPRHELKFNIYFEALKCYKEIYGNLSMRQSYVIPQNSDKYPSHLWGIRLGRVWFNIRKRGDFRPYRHRLCELGINITDSKDEIAEKSSEMQNQENKD